MRAVILAGGAGTRLRPLSCRRPKPMVGLLDRPVLEHILRYLRRQGITEVCLALQTLPQMIVDRFGDGAALGMRLHYEIETAPLGTAGGVAACARFVDPGESFLVIGGDAVLDLDLGPCLTLHRARQAMATLVLHRQPEPLEYGLVMTDGAGRVTRFIEKPAWSQVFCDTVNTGIYLLHPALLARIPARRPVDFARDIFPALLREGAPLYAAVAAGYWCDIGDTESYRRCCFDALDGRFTLDKQAVRARPGVWTASPLPDGVRVTAPCYIGADVRLERGAAVGPYAVVGAGSLVGARAAVAHSVLEKAELGPDTRVWGAVAARGCVVRAGAALRAGSVLGEDVLVGAHAVVCEDVRVWPGREIEPGARVADSLTGAQCRRPAVFDGQGRLSGQLHVDLTPALCLRLGAACAQAVPAGEVGVAHASGAAAGAAALALEAGARAAGGHTVVHDAGTPACAAYAAAAHRWPLSLFVWQETERLTLHVFEADGLPLGRAAERMLAGAVQRGETALARADRVGRGRRVTGMPARYAAYAAAAGPVGPLRVGAPGAGVSAALLRAALAAAGAAVSPEGVAPCFALTEDGLALTAVDERGRGLPRERLLALTALTLWESGQTVLAVPYDAPVFLDAVAAAAGGRLLRLGRDAAEIARRRLAETPPLWDGLSMAVWLCRALARGGLTLAALHDRLPPSAVSVAEVGLRGGRGAAMRRSEER
ncbi:MAG: NDP-sugar synthase, partial [Oscillospiraceae bacterium]|nr:NDP-sugar synthase [Oscillospiraceae bacterium]